MVSALANMRRQASARQTNEDSARQPNIENQGGRAFIADEAAELEKVAAAEPAASRSGI